LDGGKSNVAKPNFVPIGIKNPPHRMNFRINSIRFPKQYLPTGIHMETRRVSCETGTEFLSKKKVLLQTLTYSSL
jgi:hypothetical protein